MRLLSSRRKSLLLELHRQQPRPRRCRPVHWPSRPALLLELRSPAARPAAGALRPPASPRLCTSTHWLVGHLAPAAEAPAAPCLASPALEDGGWRRRWRRARGGARRPTADPRRASEEPAVARPGEPAAARPGEEPEAGRGGGGGRRRGVFAFGVLLEFGLFWITSLFLYMTQIRKWVSRLGFHC